MPKAAAVGPYGMRRRSRRAGSARRALILCNGEPPSRALLRRWLRLCDILIAIDGGADIARRCAVAPHIILGDLDSIQRATRAHFRSKTFVGLPRQDNTDFEKALDFTVARGFEQVVVLGAAGKRIDFTLANFASIWNYTSSLDLILVGPGWIAMPVVGVRQFRARRGAIVSLIPFGNCHGVTLHGLRYPLKDASLRLGARGISNLVHRSPFTVRVRQGKLLLILISPSVEKSRGTGQAR
jgi:thiamine pyrophosphokinase